MKKITIYFLLFILCLNFSFGQNLKDKNILIVYGGYEPHKPELFADYVEEWFLKKEANVSKTNDLKVYRDLDKLKNQNLIVQSVTMMQLDSLEASHLTKAVASGVGIAGAHGGLVDSYRSNTIYQFMIGGQFVSHPGGKVNFKVEMLEDELTKGLNDFEIFTEQYYMHFDPNIDIIAKTKFNGDIFHWIDDVEMPIAWKKIYDKGKVFFISIGHDPNEFMRKKDAWELLTRGFLWALR